MTCSTSLRVRRASAACLGALVALFCTTSGTYAQELSHPINPSNVDAAVRRQARSATDTLRILAALVQFQVDQDSRTSGDGRFVLSAPTDSIIDAPPRDKAYVEQHLRFVTNYLARTSKGRLALEWTVVDSVFTLPTVMATYSPPKTGPNTAVGNLARDTWTRVDSSGLVPQFSRYDCFVVFHAGVGRDIDLVGLLGYDPTPLDIPSLYLGPSAFKELYGEDYEGIPVNNGSFHITNSIVVPETESRLIPVIGGETLLELGINGLLCASVGSYLGLPDLFNTATGRSGIGRFGLMDGQAIFSFGGLFPPEPSAWERIRLGWATPITVGQGTTLLSLPAVSLSDTIYRIPISGSEYYLVENRNRDARRDGDTITSIFNGVTRKQYFRRDTTNFNAFDISAIAGVVTDVDEPDWSLPGGVDDDGTFYDGGVLIWHIDESVIEANLLTNSVNANPNRRGVDVEEADGSQDIGQQYGFLQPGSGSEEGTALDFWYAENPAPVNTNSFSASTFPGTATNLGAQSHVSILGFSARDPRMRAQAVVGDSIVSFVPGYPRDLGARPTVDAITVQALQDPSVFVAAVSKGQTPSRLVGTTIEGRPVLVGGKRDGTLTEAPPGSTYPAGVAVADLDGNGVVELVGVQNELAGSYGGVVAVTLADANPVDSLADVMFSMFGQQGEGVLGSGPVPSESLVALSTGGRVVFLNSAGQKIDGFDATQKPGERVAGISRFTSPNSFIVTTTDGNVIITRRAPSGATEGSNVVVNVGKPISGPATIGICGSGSSSRPLIACGTSDGYVFLLDTTLATASGFPAAVGASVRKPVALADVDGDGMRDIVVCAGSKIVALNIAGSPLDYFPVDAGHGSLLASAPVVGDVDADGNVDIVAVSEEGLVAAYNAQGRMARGFPLAAGIGEQSAAIVVRKDSVFLLVASAGDEHINGWCTASNAGTLSSTSMPWPQYQADASRSGRALTALQGTPAASEFFPPSRAYNWPNPVYDGITYFRYYVSESASVHIRIFDLAGDLVTELSGPGVPGVDNEVRWDVGTVQSGVYLARIQASGAGKSGETVVKVAIVK